MNAQKNLVEGKVEVTEGGFLFSPELVDRMKAEGWDVDENYRLVDIQEKEINPEAWELTQPRTNKRMRIYSGRTQDKIAFLE